MALHLHQELRHMRASQLTHLSTIIDQSRSWTDLLNKMSSGRFPSLCITLESAHLIKRQLGCDKSPTFALLNHWSITGRRRPTIKDLIELLEVCDLKRAEAFVWKEVLHKEQPEDTLAVEPNEHSRLAVDEQFKFENLVDVVEQIPQQCQRYSFEQIYYSTNRFCHKPYNRETTSGLKIGDGRFSSVFLAQSEPEKPNADETEQHVRPLLAAKLLKSECNIGYLVNEINLAMKISHKNILKLLGVSIGHEGSLPCYICLIYPYMQNGCLLDCLNVGMRCDNGRKIPWSQRVDIATKVAAGIAYLHSFSDGVIIHRDIKTANILISKDLNPSLGDFTLVRQLDNSKQGETQYSQNIIGTSVYMPPEAFRGDISTKFDIFSFGIVMLELLTGLKPFDEEINEDLLTFVSDKLSDIDDIEDYDEDDFQLKHDKRDAFLSRILDVKAGEWNFTKAKTMFDLALKATEVRKKDRPEIFDILTTLQTLNDR